MRRESARRLISLHDLARALEWSPFPTEVAEELGVDVPTLQARLASLTDDERRTGLGPAGTGRRPAPDTQGT